MRMRHAPSGGRCACKGAWQYRKARGCASMLVDFARCCCWFWFKKGHRGGKKRTEVTYICCGAKSEKKKAVTYSILFLFLFLFF
jgi:hypothetical protein